MVQSTSATRKHFRECKTLGWILSSPVQKRIAETRTGVVTFSLLTFFVTLSPSPCHMRQTTAISCEYSHTRCLIHRHSQGIRISPHANRFLHAHTLHKKQITASSTNIRPVLRHTKKMLYIMPVQNDRPEIPDNGRLHKNRRHASASTVLRMHHGQDTTTAFPS